MRDPQLVEQDMVEIGAIPEDGTKLAEIIAWCATHPKDVPTALHILLGKTEKPDSSSD
jgi:hypothetical protein